MIPGEKTLAGYFDWAQGHHQLATETLVPKKIVFDRDSNLAMLESWTEFRGRKGVDIPDFFGWGPVAENIGPVVKMIVFYHLDEAGRIKHFEPGSSVLMQKAVKQEPDNGAQEEDAGLAGFRTKEDVRTYLDFFSKNQFDEASRFWAPNVQVHLGDVVIEGRQESIVFFTAQRESGMSEKVVPSEITLDEDSCVLRCEVTFTAQKDFPEVSNNTYLFSHGLINILTTQIPLAAYLLQGYFGFGVETGIKTGQSIRLPFAIFYDLDKNRQAKSIKTIRLGEAVIS